MRAPLGTRTQMSRQLSAEKSSVFRGDGRRPAVLAEGKIDDRINPLDTPSDPAERSLARVEESVVRVEESVSSYFHGVLAG